MKTKKVLLSFIVLFFTSINLFSQTAEEWKKLGNAELDNKKYDKAIEYYQKAVETDSNYFDAYYNLGLAYSFIHEYEKTIEYYKKAISKKDTDPKPFFSLGYIYSINEDFDNAIEMYKKGIALKPDSPKELSYLGYLYQNKGSFIYSMMYTKKAAQMGDSLSQQFLLEKGISWENTFASPDYEKIKMNIEDELSDFYYPKLWAKYQEGDSTMTLDEKRHLYYGFAFNEKYSPYSPSKNSDQINAILGKQEPTKDDWEELVSLFNESLSTEPFGCRHLFYQHIAYKALNKLDDANINIKKIHCILNALTSSGDGLSKETAIHVIAVPNEYDYLFLHNFSRQMQVLENGGYDVLHLLPNKDGIEELWFDINRPLNHLKQSFK